MEIEWDDSVWFDDHRGGKKKMTGGTGGTAATTLNQWVVKYTTNNANTSTNSYTYGSGTQGGVPWSDDVWGTGTTNPFSTVINQAARQNQKLGYQTQIAKSVFDNDVPGGSDQHFNPSIRLTPDLKGRPQILGGYEYALPDGAILKVDAQGNYYIEDDQAQVTYKANRNRDFSTYLNASDMLAEFVKYLGTIGTKRGEALQLPIEMFVRWLVIEAATRDGDPVEEEPITRGEVIELVQPARPPQCLTCGKFMRKTHAAQGFRFCKPDHGLEYGQRLLEAA
jgi:hypothetical protein